MLRVALRRRALLCAAFLSVTPAATSLAQAQTPYVPPAGSWERRDPAQVGLDPAAVQGAVQFAVESEATASPDLLQNHLRSFGREPHGEAVGPFAVRGPASGIIVRRGYIVAEWGEPDRVENTFSVTKSFVSSVVGLAHDRGLIRDVHDRVAGYMAPILAVRGAVAGSVAPGVAVPPTAVGTEVLTAPSTGVAFHSTELLQLFDSEHNAKITWDHLLRQTSDWQGTLWGKPDWADRPPRNADTVEWKQRARLEPGSRHVYNDVRVNVLALAALNVWRRPLPQVLKEHVMDPIGASQTWRWFGYDNSWIVMDGELMQSVSGGAHWGGGMFISARDMARFGLLTLRRGRWGDRQILSEEWIRMATTPTPVEPGYGFMNFFLNTEKRRLPSAPEEAFVHLGAGQNMIYVDPVNDIVIVARWVSTSRALDGIVQRVLAGVR